MKNLVITLTALTLLVWGNDGVYYASGNQLIPIHETEIAIKKELLKIKRIHKDTLEVVVQYHFYNPGPDKQILVGFEAASPNGDVVGTPKNGQHPFISDFSITINGLSVPYQCAIVRDKNYAKGGKIDAKKLSEVITPDFDPTLPDFMYVYHFNANFKQGDNTIEHRYRYALSGTSYDAYYFDYILTAAKRWANRQIDDFTLSIDLGPCQNFLVDKSFFSDASQWRVNGTAKDTTRCAPLYNSEQCAEFFVIGGPVIFRKKDFKVTGNLIIEAPSSKLAYNVFDYRKGNLPFGIDQSLTITEYRDTPSYKILRNLPYARRGYVFKTPYIRRYYESLPWYRPDPSCKAEPEKLTQEERAWLKRLTAGKQ